MLIILHSNLNFKPSKQKKNFGYYIIFHFRTKILSKIRKQIFWEEFLYLCQNLSQIWDKNFDCEFVSNQTRKFCCKFEMDLPSVNTFSIWLEHRQNFCFGLRLIFFVFCFLFVIRWKLKNTSYGNNDKR